jgi:uncharacterized protein
MADAGELRRLQFEFAAHIRDPGHAPPSPGIEDRRLAIYRELFFNNLRDLLGRSFPVVRKVLGDARWEEMIRDWLIRHRARTPSFLELPQEFLAYLEEARKDFAVDPPFLAELAHYEWVELALSIDEREPELPGVDPAGDLLEGRPALSPLAWPLAYTWPVHRISPDFQPQLPPPSPTRLVVYRDRRDRVGFLEINLVTARLLELLDADAPVQQSGRDCLLQIAAELGHPDAGIVVAGGATILKDLRARDVLLGVRDEAR